MIYQLTVPPKHIFIASLNASIGNIVLLIVWTGGFESLLKPAYWGSNPIGLFAFVYVFAFVISGFGLSLLLLVTSYLPAPLTRRPPLAFLFTALGGLLGAGMFIWTSDPLLFGACGTLTALTFVGLSSTVFSYE